MLSLERTVPNQTSSQQSTIKYKDCLLVTRHKLLERQERDLNQICEKLSRVETLPTDINELKKIVDFYDAIIGVIPLPLQVQLLQMRKTVILFYMQSLGTAKSKAEAEEMLKNSSLEGVILPPAREGEFYRVSVYKGLLRVKEIKIEEEFIIKHET